MGIISGNLTENARIIIYDTQTNLNVVDEMVTAGAYSFPGLTSYDKIVTATHSGTGEALAYGKVNPASEPPVEIMYEVAASADDSHWYNLSFSSTNIYLGIKNSDDIVIRFQLSIPKDSSIEYAYLEFANYYHSDNWRDMDSTIKVVDSDDPVATPTYTEFAAAKNNTTATTVTWTDVPNGAVGNGTVITSCSIIPLVQETVDRAGWSTNNHIQFVFEGSGDGRRFWASADHATLNPPRLYIRFVAP